MLKANKVEREIQLTPDNCNTQKLKHLGRSNIFVGPLDEFLSITQTFSYLSELFQKNSSFLTRI